MNNTIWKYSQISGLGQVNSNRKTPEGKRRRSELEKILAKNEYYKKLKEDREIAEAKTKSNEKLKPSQIFLADADVSESTDIEIDDCGKFMALISLEIQIIYLHSFMKY